MPPCANEFEVVESDDCKKSEIRKTGVAGLINQDVGLIDDSVEKNGMTQLVMTYPFEIPMDHILTVHVDQALCNVSQLREPCNRQCQVRIVGA